eukprot:6202428-Pleurochrysis_carterae.AAC.2
MAPICDFRDPRRQQVLSAATKANPKSQCCAGMHQVGWRYEKCDREEPDSGETGAGTSVAVVVGGNDRRGVCDVRAS